MSKELKQLAVVAAVAIAVIFGLTGCEDPCKDGGCGTDDTYPHGVIYVPPMGKSPGVGPIFY
ncbi:hypothetical protein CRB1_39 [Mycobacterium phage CRB1]|uniref:hypothetical protein n=1 Tax=Mycobacterium phage CRB1 TaxID=1458841 RepID=UPI0003F1CB1E|nr:hypothetical protein CRB1_39 [Mycobacterium phage CRB1]AHJ86650.1 hypothetical protein CRB1_39 [Mycobacterium phage CRB1]